VLSILGFLAVLAPLVIVHELGHFFFAKLFNVKAEVFSVGFGPRLFTRKWGETEWCVSAIPLGGYVKLLGEETESDKPLTEEELKRSLPRQAPWKRFFIFFGGPLFNFLWAIVVFAVIFVIGEPQVSNVVGRVVEQSIAEKAGLRSGDRIVSIDGQLTDKWEEVDHYISAHPRQTLNLDVDRAGTGRIVVSVETTATRGFNHLGEFTTLGAVEGMSEFPRATTIGVSNPETVAWKAGIRLGYSISEFQGVPVKTWEEVQALYQGVTAGTEASLKLVNQKGKDPVELKLLRAHDTETLTEATGMHSSELFVEKVMEKTPAEQAGMQAGDRLLRVNGKGIYSFIELRNAIQSAGEAGEVAKVEWERDGKTIAADITPASTAGTDPALRKVVQHTIGVVPALVRAEPVLTVLRILNPITLVYKATERMLSLTSKNFASIGKMFSGSVSVGTLGGPILIGKLAGESLSQGLISFLTMMGILSIGLGVLNVLPVPVLDGGHLLLLAIEAVRGKPLSLRQMEVLQQVGLALILLLMLVVMRNDVLRLVN